jgi:hypothetical protein
MMPPSSHTGYDAVAADNLQDESQDNASQSRTSQEHIHGEGCTATSTLVIHEQELQGRDCIISHSRDASGMTMQVATANEHSQFLESSTPNSEHEREHNTSVNRRPSIESREVLQERTIGWLTTSLLVGCYLLGMESPRLLES